ncbi:MAG: ATP-binding protein [Caldiserica bacterium]|nr:MAG: ATP-binding protein [Caldisericota bacterium]
MRVDFEKIKEEIRKRMKKIKKKIVVMSNKGGVGKTQVSVNLSCVLSEMGKKVGLLDADVHGPSVVKALGLEGERLRASDEGIFPLEKGNLKVISMGAVLEREDSPVIWRGPLKAGAIRQFLSEVEWGELDYLIVDSPPGTGDEPLSVIQLIGNLDGGIVVTTPQDIALLDSKKCVNFLKELKVPVLGIIENMSGLICPYCGGEIEIFKKGGGEKAAKELNVPFLGRIPFDPRIVEVMDKGLNFILEFPDSEVSQRFKQIVSKI